MNCYITHQLFDDRPCLSLHHLALDHQLFHEYCNAAAVVAACETVWWKLWCGQLQFVAIRGWLLGIQHADRYDRYLIVDFVPFSACSGLPHFWSVTEYDRQVQLRPSAVNVLHTIGEPLAILSGIAEEMFNCAVWLLVHVLLLENAPRVRELYRCVFLDHVL